MKIWRTISIEITSKRSALNNRYLNTINYGYNWILNSGGRLEGHGGRASFLSLAQWHICRILPTKDAVDYRIAGEDNFSQPFMS